MFWNFERYYKNEGRKYILYSEQNSQKNHRMTSRDALSQS